MKKLWKVYLKVAPDLNMMLLGVDLGLLVGMVLGIAYILAHNNGII